MAEAETAENEAADKADTGSETAAVAVADAHLPEAVDSGDRSGGGQIDILLDATMSISARLGEAEISVRELLQVGPGAVLKLDRQVGEPIDLFLRGIKFATGHLVVVGEQLGVRIKEILSQDPGGAK